VSFLLAAAVFVVGILLLRWGLIALFGLALGSEIPIVTTAFLAALTALVLGALF
jgi:hypothetical protein